MESACFWKDVVTRPGFIEGFDEKMRPRNAETKKSFARCFVYVSESSDDTTSPHAWLVCFVPDAMDDTSEADRAKFIALYEGSGLSEDAIVAMMEHVRLGSQKQATVGEHKCDAPGCDAPGKKKCVRCQTARYCGKACQNVDWKAHKKMCGKPVETPSAPGPNVGQIQAQQRELVSRHQTPTNIRALRDVLQVPVRRRVHVRG
jgi:hypothetical protein